LIKKFLAVHVNRCKKYIFRIGFRTPEIPGYAQKLPFFNTGLFLPACQKTAPKSLIFKGRDFARPMGSLLKGAPVRGFGLSRGPFST
jgi:hypothetical protein